MKLKSNKQIELAYKFLGETGAHIFLTGRAGTGKTTFLRNALKSLNKRVVVAAPTGVAAINAGGVTLHSLFQLPFSMHIPSSGSVQSSRQSERGGRQFKIGKQKLALIRSIELLVIDEISMVRCDLLDAIDETLRRVRRDGRPFGGVQLLMIGDIQQLSPICHDTEWMVLREYYNTPYFFDSKALRACDYVTIELQEIFRQSDTSFTDLLNAVRDNAITEEVIARLNERYVPNFNPPKKDGYITLSTHNHSANAINTRKLSELKTHSEIFTATVKGDYPESAYPNDKELELKVGAQVIFIKNDLSPEKLYYNGLLGEVISLSPKCVVVKPNGGGNIIEVEAIAWENIEYSLDSDSGEIQENIKGSFTQIPLKCAWAITIHKSQGLSFDRAVIDASSSFAHGQVYVALSRCRTLEGMVLSSPLRLHSIIKDRDVENFSNYVAESQPNDDILARHRRSYFCTALCDIFAFGRLRLAATAVVKLLSGHLYMEYPTLCNNLAESAKTIKAECEKVGESFQQQIIYMVTTCEGNYMENKYIAERLQKATDYFMPRIEPLKALYAEANAIDPDFDDFKKKMNEVLGDLRAELFTKLRALELCRKGFSVVEYQTIRAEVLAGGLKADGKGKKKKEKTPKTPKVPVSQSPSVPKSPKKTKPPKEPKISTVDITYNMYREGMAIEKIAEERGYVISTIQGHLAQCVERGDIHITDLVDAERIVEIEKARSRCAEECTLTDIKNELDESYNFGEIRIVVGTLKRPEPKE